MKRSRTALALFLCTFIVSLSAVGFAEGESRPLCHLSGFEPDDVDQLDFGFRPSCSWSVPRGVAACESSFNIDGANGCFVTAEAMTTANWIGAVWSDWRLSLSGEISRQINDCASFVGSCLRNAELNTADCGDAEVELSCEDWIETEQAAAAQAAKDSHFLYVLSGAWRAKHRESVDCFDCFDGWFAIEECLRNDDSRTADIAADSRHSTGAFDAIILNESSQGINAEESAEDENEAIVRFVADNFGPMHALAISRHAPAREHQYEGLWIGCDAFPDASTQGWLDDAARAVTLQTWRAIVSPLADLASQAVRGSQEAVQVASQQIAVWLIERGASVVSESPRPQPSKPDGPWNATRSNEFIVL